MGFMIPSGIMRSLVPNCLGRLGLYPNASLKAIILMIRLIRIPPFTHGIVEMREAPCPNVLVFSIGISYLRFRATTHTRRMMWITNGDPVLRIPPSWLMGRVLLEIPLVPAQQITLIQLVLACPQEIVDCEVPMWALES